MARCPSNPEMEIVTINIPRKIAKLINKLRKWGLVPSRSEVFRHAGIKYVQELYELMEKIDKDLEDFDPKKFVRVPGYNGNRPLKIIRRLD